MDSSTTFKVSDVKVERVTNTHDVAHHRTATSKDRESICAQLAAFKRNHCSVVLVETQFASIVRVQASENNGFVQTVIDCYNKRHNLIIRPDDIWSALMTQFSFYLSKHVELDGKKELVVHINRSDCSAPFDHFLSLIKEKIDENLVDQQLKELIWPNFTTTTTNDIISCGIAFIATTKTKCSFVRRTGGIKGIPYVTLEGTVADWQNIRNRLEALKNYKLEKWYEMLRPILNEFIAAKQHEENVEFWNRIVYHHLSSDSVPGHIISGWLTAFAVFNEDGKECVDLTALHFPSIRYDDEVWPMLEIDNIPSGIVTVNVKIFDGIGEYESIMVAGHIAYKVWEDDFTLQPQIGWGLALKSTAEEVEILHETARRNGDFKCDSCKTFFL